MAKRQLVLMARREGGEEGGSAGGAGGGGGGSMGSVKDVVATLKGFNCWPDGSGPEGLGKSPGMALAYGPGLILEIPMMEGASGEVAQVLATMTDEEFAFPVLMRLCRAAGWTMMDPESGRVFG